MSALRIVPCTAGAAKRWILATHRHLPEVNGGRWAVACAIEGRVVGVGLVGNGPRLWEGTGKMVITRVATDGTPNACSKLYGALCRAGRELGYTEAWTYTLPEEPGTSLRAAGFEDMGLTAGGEHGRKNRPRRPAKRPEPKRRWRRILEVITAPPPRRTASAARRDRGRQRPWRRRRAPRGRGTWAEVDR